MNRRLVAGAAIIVVGIAGTSAAIWKLTKKPGSTSAAAVVEPGVLFVGKVEPAHGSRSAGCDAHEERPEGREFTWAGRKFFVWGPKANLAPAPVVLAFHGWGSNGRGFQQWFQMDKYAEGAYVVYPDSLDANWDYSGNRDIDFVRAILEKMSATYCVDTTRVLAVGFSYGGRFTNHLGCKAPDLVRGIVVAGSRWDKDETTCVGTLPVLVVHRTHDETMPISGGQNAAERWSKIDGCAASAPVSNGCVAWDGCAQGGVTFCEDKHFDPEWPKAWNHTMRESYELLAWRWFEQLK